ncbi:MAG: hypothetical protein GY797_33395 [Deltaproteobacteria bacterium]|nr:hypothetical protein [Deltaproteobacteria bacterium]
MATTFGRTDKIDIFNLVATLLSTEAITDTEFATPTLKVTKSIVSVYRIARNALLREHNWRFARVVTELIDAPATVTLLGWNYFYYYPDYANLPTGNNKPQGSAYLRNVFTDTESQDPEPIDYKLFNVVDPDNSIDGVFIATQEDDAYAEYTNYGLDDLADDSTYGGVNSLHYDPMFSEVLGFKIAAMICKTVTGDINLADNLARRFNTLLAKTKIYDKREEKLTNTKLKTNDYIDAR